MSLWWAVVFLSIFFIGITKSGFGSGVGLMIVPMALLGLKHTSYGSEATLGLMLPLLIIGDLIAVWQYRHLFSMKIVRKLLPGTALGVLVGAMLLYWLDTHKSNRDLTTALIEIEVGLESAGLVSLHWWRTWRGEMERFANPGPVRSSVVGSAAGVSSTLAHAAGPIISLYLLPQKLDRQLYVGTCAIYFFLLNTAKLPAYRLSGQFTPHVLLLSAKTLPLVVAGALVGVWLNRRMNDLIFSKIVYFVTFLLGWYLLYAGTQTLTH